MSWIVLKTKGRHEDIAASYVKLHDDTIETFLPKILIKKTPDAELTPQPLFPNYLFVKIAAQWRFLLSTIGVLGVIYSVGDDKPATVEQKVIDAIKLKQGRDGYIVLPKAPRFAKGQPVRLKSGLFEGRVGIYQGSSSLEREMILLKIMGRETPISVGASSIVAAA